MGWLRQLGFAITAGLAYVGAAPTPDTDVERATRIDEMYADYRKEFPEVTSITAAELLTTLKSNPKPVVVDVRSNKERAISTIPGAITMEAFESHQKDYVGRTVVAYCTIGYRSGLWAKKMSDQGVEVLNLEGSLLTWTHVGGPLVTSTGDATQRVHVYGPAWDLAHSTYQATW